MSSELPAAIQALYPFRSRYLDVSNARMHYVDEGSGPVILMLHGNPTWSFYFRNLIIGLRDRFRIVAPDHIGCGLSDKPRGYSYTLAQHMANVATLVEKLGLARVTLLVHDWGGAIGFGWAVDHVDRVRALIITNTAAFTGGRCPWRIRVCRLPVVGDFLVRGLNGFAKAALVMAVHKRERITSAVRAGLLYPYDSYGNRAAIQRFVRDIPLRATHPSYATLRCTEARLSELGEKPMTIHWGMHDWCFDESFLREWTRRFPGAVVFPYDDAGHYVIEDAHERILTDLQPFLREQLVR